MNTIITIEKLEALLRSAEEAHAKLPDIATHDWVPFYAQHIMDELEADEAKATDRQIAEANANFTFLSLI